ncbi:hypothetical protein [Desulfoluna sp.]|uniref:hypothetical protein n=1 Tax=Desulfoluna sp. TaxID=2045199 RepID=UPI00262DC071|nr:hypothetical protein [Desulfoluna sp.]
MIKRAVVLTALSFFLILIGSTAWAEGRQHSLGVDLVRPIDEDQYGGMVGVSYQVSLESHSAFVGTLARRSGYTVFEGLYKVYIDSYFDGPFAAGGLVTGRYDGESELGLIGALGYELSIDQNIVLSGSVECTWGSMDHPSTSHRNPIFRPSLSLIFAF